MGPQIGDLVQVRQRRWVVANVNPSVIIGSAAKHHLIDLTSIEEDARTETLSVVWEVEPDAKIKHPNLPEAIKGFDDYSDFENFLNAVRWGVVTNVDSRLIQAPFRSGITIEDYQLDPVVRAVNMARVNLLIADDVGLGKTIEAGLVVQEMLLRHRARSVLIVCPASLQTKWQEEMQSKFGLEFRIVDSAYLSQLRRRRGVRANPWTSFPRLITSMDWAKTGDGLEYLRETLKGAPSYPRTFDILIVDEAHNVAPADGVHDSMRTALIRRLVPHFSHHLFLTATPHNGNPGTWQVLLELLDNQRFTRGVEPDPDLLAHVLVRRLKSSITDPEGNPIFPKRMLMELPVAYTEKEREVHLDLKRYMELRRRSVENSDETTMKGMMFVLATLKKRLFSSPRAFSQTLACHVNTLERLKKQAEQRPTNAEVAASVNDAENEEEKPDSEVLAERLEKVKPGDPTFDLTDNDQEAIKAVTKVAPSLTKEEEQVLNKLKKWARANESNPDSKILAIARWIKENILNEGEWSNRRVILFSEYTATLNMLSSYLMSSLKQQGLDLHARIERIDGMTPADERERIKAAFQADPALSPVRILLASDAASEGIDLQNWCADIIHVEIPWNPNVLEQRNGRIDRHGQKRHEVFIWHPVGDQAHFNVKRDVRPGNLDDDSQYLLTVCRKIEQIRNDIGSASDVLSQQIMNDFLGIDSPYSHDIEQRRIAETKKRLKAESKFAERAKKLHETIKQTIEDLDLEPQVIESAVRVAMRIAAREPLRPYVPEAGSKVKPEDLPKLFTMPRLLGAWGQAFRGIHDPFTGKPRPVTFDSEIARRYGQEVVLLHLNHPLVAMSLRLLREEVWAPERAGRLNRVAVKLVKEDLDGIGVVVISRLLITAKDGGRLHEELTLAGGVHGEKRFRREAVQARLREWLDAGDPVEAKNLSEVLKNTIAERYLRDQPLLDKADDERSEERRRSMLTKLAACCEVEKLHVEEILKSLAAGISKFLNGSALQEGDQGFMPSLFELNELEVGLSDKTRDELRLRLEAIPQEIKAEMRAVEARFSVNEQDARRLPVGMVFLIPESMVN